MICYSLFYGLQASKFVSVAFYFKNWHKFDNCVDDIKHCMLFGEDG